MRINQCSWIVLLSLVLTVGSAVPQAVPDAPQVRATEAPQGELLRVTVSPATLGYIVDEFAGLRVRVPKARVTTIFDPRAFVVESVWLHGSGRGFHDRILVLTEGAGLRVTQEHLAGSTVTILGVAKSILGTRLLTSPPWPAALNSQLMDQLEVRAVIIATSVQSTEGDELTQ
jgi:hypothetical protein